MKNYSEIKMLFKKRQKNFTVVRQKTFFQVQGLVFWLQSPYISTESIVWGVKFKLERCPNVPRIALEGIVIIRGATTENAGENSEKCIPRAFDQRQGSVFWLPSPYISTESIVWGVKCKLGTCPNVPRIILEGIIIIRGATAEKRR